MKRFDVLIGVLVVCATASTAQDRRKVTEPRIPPVSRTLDAQLVAANGDLAEADENKLDTTRIQEAIDSCQSGTAVELRSASENVLVGGWCTMWHTVIFVFVTSKIQS